MNNNERVDELVRQMNEFGNLVYNTFRFWVVSESIQKWPTEEAERLSEMRAGNLAKDVIDRLGKLGVMQPGSNTSWVEVGNILRASYTIARVRNLARLHPETKDYWDRHFASLTLDEICDTVI